MVAGRRQQGWGCAGRGVGVVPFHEEEVSPELVQNSGFQGVIRTPSNWASARPPSDKLRTGDKTGESHSPVGASQNSCKADPLRTRIWWEPGRGELPLKSALGFQGSCPDSHEALVPEKRTKPCQRHADPWVVRLLGKK